MIETLGLGWLGCMVAATVWWLESLRRKDVSIVDVLWGLFFLGLTAWAWLRGQEDGAFRLLHLALVTVWALRLSAHIATRSRGRGEDRRYAEMRERHGERFRTVSLFTVFLLQATLATAIAVPLVAVQLAPRLVAPVWAAVGMALWTIGFLFEAVADRQLLRFQRSDRAEDGVLKTGLWRYSRHPNYFGECVLWWGYGAWALAVGAWWTLYSPLVMTLLLLKISGVSLMEKGAASRRPGYEDYARRTSAFVPRPPRDRERN